MATQSMCSASITAKLTGATDIEEFGMSKIILDKKGKIIGAHILGTHASEVLHEIQLAKRFNIPFERYGRRSTCTPVTPMSYGSHRNTTMPGKWKQPAHQLLKKVMR